MLPSQLAALALALALPALTLAIPIPLHAQSDPTRFLLCESSNRSCTQPNAAFDTVWTFNGTEGTASAPGAAAPSHLTIETLDAHTLVVRRTEPSGLTALYTGQIHTGQGRGTHIDGTVEFTWPGHPGYPATGLFAATSQDLQDPATAPSPSAASQPALPPELLVCENGLCNAAWTLQGAAGTGTWFDRNPSQSPLSILRSAPDDILIRRAPGPNGVSATYAGRFRGDHYSGTVIFSSPGHAGDASASWTATIPITQCPSQAGLGSADALRIGQTALMFHHDRDAFDCYLVAARAGDSTAQAAVGLSFYQGRPAIPQDYAQAFFWLRKAADQGIYAAQRTVAEMYIAGQGTAPNSTLAAIYTRRADEQKHDLERRQDLNERELDRRNQVLSSFVLGASFGLFF